MPETLRERLWMKDTALTTSRARRGLIEAVARWIARIHTRGVWQRDLKPHNVLVPCTAEEIGEPVMFDIAAVRQMGSPVSAERCARNLGQIIDVPVPLDREIGAPLLAAYMREAGIEDESGAWRRTVYEEVERRRSQRLKADGYLSIDEPLAVLEPTP
jgi:hypothetical protein